MTFVAKVLFVASSHICFFIEGIPTFFVFVPLSFFFQKDLYLINDILMLCYFFFFITLKNDSETILLIPPLSFRSLLKHRRWNNVPSWAWRSVCIRRWWWGIWLTLMCFFNYYFGYMGMYAQKKRKEKQSKENKTTLFDGKMRQVRCKFSSIFLSEFIKTGLNKIIIPLCVQRWTWIWETMNASWISSWPVITTSLPERFTRLDSFPHHALIFF